MPRTAGKPNPVFDGLKEASEHLTNAKEQLEKKPNDAALKKSLDVAQKKYDDANAAAKRHRFLNTTVKRAENAIKALTFLGRSFDKRTYTYSVEEAKQVLDTLNAQVKKTVSSVENAMSGTSESKAAPGKLFDFK
jgi:hypothetical protein